MSQEFAADAAIVSTFLFFAVLALSIWNQTQPKRRRRRR